MQNFRHIAFRAVFLFSQTEDDYLYVHTKLVDRDSVYVLVELVGAKYTSQLTNDILATGCESSNFN